MAKLFIILTFVLHTSGVTAQMIPVIKEGIIEFERKIRIYPGGSPDAVTQNIHFRTTHYTLRFTKNNTAYLPAASNQLLDRTGIQPAENNTVFSDNRSQTFLSLKKIFDEQFAVEDSLPRINWKITSEKRTIAGFECRRANALLFDSIYIVAFYSDDIPISSGPELFNGLPGMILAISLPHLHIHMTATRMIIQPVSELSVQKLTPERPPISVRQLKDQLLKVSPSWGTNRTAYLVQSLF